MFSKHQSFVVLALLLIALSGCREISDTSSDEPTQMSAAEREQLIDAVLEAEREAQKTTPPKPKIVLPTPSGWSRSESRALPPEDHGFTVAYEYESGLSVTLYQYTRGHASIPDGVDSALVKEEMQHAKTGIQQVVQLGYWDAAKEVKFETVRLGESQRQALWSQYDLTVDGEVLASDIYVWAYSNTLFKLRCTAHSKDVVSNQAVLGSLLTALGSPSAGTNNDEE